MINNRLLEVSLPTNNEQKIINYIGKSKRDNRNKAQILAFTNSLILAKTDVERYQLYAMLLKDYILNRCNGKINSNIELDEIINSMDIENAQLVKENICFLMQYLEVDDMTRFKLASNFVNTLVDKNNRAEGIREYDKDTCTMLCENLNGVIESKVRINSYSKVYRKVSNR